MSIRINSFFILIFFLTFAGIESAQAQEEKERLDIGISRDVIAITSDFEGADIVVFGALDRADPEVLRRRGYDIIVTLTGPKLATVVRRKENFFGIWINRSSTTFEPIASSFSLSSTRPIELISEAESLQQNEIGIKNIRLQPKFLADDMYVHGFRKALRRIKLENGQYQRDPWGVEFVSASLFKAPLRLPASIPVGVHRLQAYLYKENKLIMEREISLHVVKTGLEQFVYDFAHKHSLFYGLLAVLLAMVTGWLAGVIFRRD